MSVIDFFRSGTGHALYQPTTIESVYLQLRKILELIAMASLVVNKRVYAKAYADYAKHWNGKRLLHDLGRVNPSFYPQPFKEEPATCPGTASDWTDISSGYLTQNDFIALYNKCGAVLHAYNPFGTAIDYVTYERELPDWRGKIVTLLGCHKIRLLNDPNVYVIHMKESRDDKVHGYTFAPTSPPGT